MEKLEERVRELLGSALPEDQIRSLLIALRHDLELAVGRALAATLTDEQLDEFDELTERGDEEGASAWLRRTCPDFPRVIDEQRDALLERLRQSARTL